MLSMDFKVDMDQAKVFQSLGIEDQGRVQTFIDETVLRLCSPFIPHESGTLDNSGTNNTRLGSGLVHWSTPYARRWFYEPAKFQGAPIRGNYWGPRMLNNGGREQLRDGIAKMMNRGNS